MSVKKLKERAERVKIDIPTVFLALRRAETPLGAKLLAGLTVAYALSPIDLIPDFIPVLGYLDDLIVLPILVALTVKRIPNAVLDDCRRSAEGMWENGKPKRWYFALPIVLIWALVLFLITKAIWVRIG